MNDVSSSRRKIGIAAITTTALALPLTASISYAQPPVSQDNDEAAIETIDPSADEDTVVWVSQDEDGDAQVHEERHVEVRVIREEGEDGERRVIRRVIRNGQETEMSEAELEAMMAEIEREMEGLDERVERHVEMAMRHSAEAAEMGHRMMVFTDEDGARHEFEMQCDDENTVVTRELDDGRRAFMICQTQVRAHAARGIEAARAAIAANPELSEETREEILRELEEAMEELREHRVSALTPPKPSRAPAAPRAPEPVRASVAYRWNVELAPAVELIPMVSPITGVSMAPAASEDCDEDETPRAAPRARIRASA